MLSRKRTLALDEWLKEATAGLCEPAIAEIGQRVRAEVEAEAVALEGRGLLKQHAEHLAFCTLGQPNAVNYRWQRYHLKPLEYAGMSILLKCYPPWKYLRWQDRCSLAFPWLMGLWALTTLSNDTAPLAVQLIWGTFICALLFWLLISVVGYVIDWIALRAERYLSEVVNKSRKRNLTLLGVLASGELIYAIGLYLVSPALFFISLQDLCILAAGLAVSFAAEMTHSANRARRIALLEKDNFQYVIPASLQEARHGAGPMEEARLTR